jgi:hypothetical protein
LLDKLWFYCKLLTYQQWLLKLVVFFVTVWSRCLTGVARASHNGGLARLRGSWLLNDDLWLLWLLNDDLWLLWLLNNNWGLRLLHNYWGLRLVHNDGRLILNDNGLLLSLNDSTGHSREHSTGHSRKHATTHSRIHATAVHATHWHAAMLSTSSLFKFKGYYNALILKSSK